MQTRSVGSKCMVCKSGGPGRRASQASHSSDPCSCIWRSSTAFKAEITRKEPKGKAETRRGREKQAKAMGFVLRRLRIRSIVRPCGRLLLWHRYVSKCQRSWVSSWQQEKLDMGVIGFVPWVGAVSSVQQRTLRDQLVCIPYSLHCHETLKPSF